MITGLTSKLLAKYWGQRVRNALCRPKDKKNNVWDKNLTNVLNPMSVFFVVCIVHVQLYIICWGAVTILVDITKLREF